MCPEKIRHRRLKLGESKGKARREEVLRDDPLTREKGLIRHLPEGDSHEEGGDREEEWAAEGAPDCSGELPHGDCLRRRDIEGARELAAVEEEAQG